MTSITVRGFQIYPGLLDLSQQRDIVRAVRECLAQAPLFRPVTPRGKAMTVRMSSAGRFGWFADRSGYRYALHHPNGADWPPIPALLLDIWRNLVPKARAPESCLINWYDADARMGLHQDRDESDFSQPVLSLSLGDDALFRMGSETRGGKTESIWLRSGDAVVLAGPSRLAFHGVDRIRPGSSTLLPNPGRINLTLRVVT